MSRLKKFELGFLWLMILALPTFEAPKNIFLVLFVIVGVIRLLAERRYKEWAISDTLFFALVASSLLSSIFAGFEMGSQWKGFAGSLAVISVGWLLSRANYSANEVKQIFIVTLVATIPALIWAYYDIYSANHHIYLQLHSVGHVNHSAIYLVMIFGGCFSYALDTWDRFNSLGKILWGGYAFLLFITLIVSESRAAVLSAYVIAALIPFFMKTSHIRKAFIFLIMVGVMVFSYINDVRVVEKQLENQKNNYVLSGREKVWPIALEVARKYPLFGIGNSNYHQITPELVKSMVESRGAKYSREDYLFVGHAHNLYLMNLVERGMVGLASIILFMVGWIYLLFFNSNQNLFFMRNHNYLWAASFAAWISTFGIGLVNSTFHHEHAILACLFLSLYQIDRNRDLRSPS